MMNREEPKLGLERRLSIFVVSHSYGYIPNEHVARNLIRLVLLVVIIFSVISLFDNGPEPVPLHKNTHTPPSKAQVP